MEHKHIQKGVYRMPPPETPARYKGSTPRASWITVYRLRAMEDADIDALGLRRYLRDEGGAEDNAAAK